MRSGRFFWFGVVPALFLQGIGAYLYFVVLADTAAASPMYGAVKVLLLLWPLAWLKLGAPLPKFSLSFTRRSIALGLTCGIAMASVIAAFAAIDFDNLLSFGNTLSTKADDLFPLAYYIPVAIVFSLFHALFEEYFWRWFVFGGLQLRLSDVAASIVGSLGFTLHHVIVLSQFFPAPLVALGSLGVFAGGLIWCRLYRDTRSLGAAWISHAVVDLTLFAIGYAIIFAN